MTEFYQHEGHMLSAEHVRIATVIHDYDPNLELAWVPPERRTLNEEHPYAVIHNDPNGSRNIVMRLRENEVDHRVIARLWERDSKYNNVLAAIEADEAARQAIAMLRAAEDKAEKDELAAWMIQAPVGARHNGIRLT